MIKIAELEFESIYEVEAFIQLRMHRARRAIDSKDFEAAAEILVETGLAAACLSDHIMKNPQEND